MSDQSSRQGRWNLFELFTAKALDKWAVKHGFRDISDARRDYCDQDISTAIVSDFVKEELERIRSLS